MKKSKITRKFRERIFSSTISRLFLIFCFLQLSLSCVNNTVKIINYNHKLGEIKHDLLAKELTNAKLKAELQGFNVARTEEELKRSKLKWAEEDEIVINLIK